jgi:hypothetical protein
MIAIFKLKYLARNQARYRYATDLANVGNPTQFV